jgi:DNA-binding NarL/FixJ family response regulator
LRSFFLYRPDVLLLDFRMPEMNGLEAVHVILEKAPKTKIIVLGTYDRDEGVDRALQAGAKAYLLNDSLARNCSNPFGMDTSGN